MNVKLFTIRLDDNMVADQDAVNKFLDSVAFKKSSSQFVPGEPDYWSVILFYDTEIDPKSKKRAGSTKSAAPEISELSPEEIEIVSALKQWRKSKAEATNVPDFLIFQNATLHALSRQRPRNLSELSQIKGIGQQKVAQYGEDVIAVLNAF